MSVHPRVTLRRLGPFPEVSLPVFIGASSIIFAFIIFGAVFTSTADVVFSAARQFVATYFSWFYILCAAFFLGFVIWVAASRYGHVRLGDPNEEPAFSLFGWFAMLFSAGMGIGLLFWGVAEPINHYAIPPFGVGGTEEAAETALRYTFFHWGLHAWGIYSLVGLAIAYFSFRQKLPLAIRSVFYPVLGDRIYGWQGHVVDIFAVIATMFGVSTSLGLGVMQINSGLNFLIGLPQTPTTQVALIAAVTAAATTSVVIGLSAGIQRLSQLNVILSAIFLTFIFLSGPTFFLLQLFVEEIGRYLQNILVMTFWNDAFHESGWQENWTTYYWGWWIAWSPFVGMFIARVSRGRTIREFVAGVLLTPTLVTFLWLSVLGGSALQIEWSGAADIVAAVEDDVSTALFVMLAELPWPQLTAALGTLIVVTFFVTSSDSGSLVIDMLTAGGHADPPRVQRVFWAVTEGVVAAVLLLVGGLGALQTASIVAGLPFCAIMLGMCWCLFRGLRTEPIAPDPEQIEPDAPDSLMGEEEAAPAE